MKNASFQGQSAKNTKPSWDESDSRTDTTSMGTWAYGADGDSPSIHPNAVRKIQTLSALKPMYHQDSRIRRAEVCKELLPTGTAHMWNHVLDWRIRHRLPTKNLQFIDLGSGIGGVVFATLVIHADIIQNAFGVELSHELNNHMHTWLDAAETNSTALQNTVEIRKKMIQGDFTNDQTVVGWIQNSDVVFCNNLLYEPDSTLLPELAGVSLNERLRQLLTNALIKHGACVVTTCALDHRRRCASHARSISRSGACLVTQHQFPFQPHHVSWGGRVSGYIATRVSE
jgi:hypothetical protein